jgi:hypothetical protein
MESKFVEKVIRPSIKEPVSLYIGLWCNALSTHTPQCSLPQLHTDKAQLMPEIPAKPKNVKFLLFQK